jgi:hypothetical protein
LPLVAPLLPATELQQACSTEQPPALERADWEAKVLAAVDNCVMLDVALREKLHK